MQICFYLAILSYGLSKATNIPLKYTIWTGYLSFPLWLTREAFGLSKTPSDDEVVYKIFKTIWWDYSQLYLMNAVSSFSFNSDLNYGFFPPSLDIINDHIALGRCPVSREVDIFKDEPYNIIGIINMCRETKGPIDKYKEYGIECHNFPTLDDTEPKESDVDKAVELIDKLIEDKNNDESKNGKRILVHCAFGRGRSTTIVLCHLIKSTGMSIKQAFEFVQSKRKWASHSVIEYNVVNAYGLKYSNKH